MTLERSHRAGSVSSTCTYAPFLKTGLALALLLAWDLNSAPAQLHFCVYICMYLYAPITNYNSVQENTGGIFR